MFCINHNGKGDQQLSVHRAPRQATCSSAAASPKRRYDEFGSCKIRVVTRVNSAIDPMSLVRSGQAADVGAGGVGDEDIVRIDNLSSNR